ncbi:hypothetical protein BDN72DRAFT_850540, partial [Pluteus cervinus]
YAAPTPLGPDVFSSTPFTLLYGRSAACDCGPQDRALNDIVRSCVLTIFACIYTALHPNIPDPEATMWQKICGRLKMSFYMLIAPEAVIWWAMRQWYGARTVAYLVNNLKPELKWTTTHGHFVQMGGLEGIHSDGRRQCIHAIHLHPYWKHGYGAQGRLDLDELQFPKKQVQDRSKGDLLSKGLVALQTSWFVLECIARFRQHLPITELEVVTLAFAALNTMTYGFWWDKPLNVNCQIQIHIKPKGSSGGPQTHDTWEGGGNEVEGQGHQEIETENSSREYEIDSNDATEGGDNNQLLMTPIGRDQGNGDGRTTKNGRNQEHSSSTGQNLFYFLVMRPFTALEIDKGARFVPMFYGYKASEGDLLRIRLTSCIIGMIFAGIHFIAWSSHFPTHLELVLWRSSSLVVLVIPFFVGLFGILLRDWDFATEASKADEWILSLGWGTIPTMLLRALRRALYILGPILYILARISLIVQAFISLRDLQPTIFQNIAWTSYIPHL